MFLLLITGCNAVSDTNSGHPAGRVEQAGTDYMAQSGPAGEKLAGEKEKPSLNDTSSSGKPADSITWSDDEPINLNQEEKSPQSVSLLVTRDYRNEILFNQKVALSPGNSVIDLLKANLDLKTKYGGGFVDSINGLKGGSQGGVMQDWFYYVNGVSPDIGSSDYILNPGDVVWWDYHRWQAGPSNPVVIGSYPEPFLHGYQGKVKGTSIMRSDAHTALADTLMASLKSLGVSNVKAMDIKEELLNNPQGPIIVIGEWNELSKFDVINQINQNSGRRGIPVHFTGDTIELTNYQGQTGQTISESAGVIVATASGLGDSCPIWLVIGTDPSALKSAINNLIKPGAVAGMNSIVVLPELLIPLPLN